MNRSIKTTRASILAVVLAMSLLAISASSAMASVVNWSSTTSGLKLSGTLTIYKDGASAKTCTGATSFGDAYDEGGFSAGNYTGGLFRLTCTGSTYLVANATGFGYLSDGLTLVFDGWSSVNQSPYGNWYQDTVEVPFTNASAATPSHATFSNTTLGTVAAGGTITATGTLNVTTASGGQLTLSQ